MNQYKIDYLYNDEIQPYILSVLNLIYKYLSNEQFYAEHFIQKNNILNTSDTLYKNGFHHLLIWNLNNNTSKLLVKKLDAICSYIEYETCIYLMVICIDENLWGKNIGKMLLEEIYKKNIDKKEIWVKIEKHNDKSIKFFTKNKFEKRIKKSAPNVISKSFRKPYDLYCYNPNNF